MPGAYGDTRGARDAREVLRGGSRMTRTRDVTTGRRRAGPKTFPPSSADHGAQWPLGPGRSTTGYSDAAHRGVAEKSRPGARTM